MKLTLVFLLLCGATLQIVKSDDLLQTITNPLVPGSSTLPGNAGEMYDSAMTGYKFLKFMNSAAAWGQKVGNSLLDSAAGGIQWIKSEINNTPPDTQPEKSLKDMGTEATDSIQNGASQASGMIINKASQTVDEFKSVTSPTQSDTFSTSKLTESLFN